MALTESEKENLSSLLGDKISQLESSGEAEKNLARTLKRQTKEIRSQIDALPSAEEKFNFLEKTFFRQMKENLRLSTEESNLKRTNETLRRERDIFSSDYSKVNAVKEKLDALCKELQKQNKLIVADAKRIAAEENAKRLEMAESFQASCKEITEKMEIQLEERERHHKENEMLREKLTELFEHMDVQTKHYEQKFKAKDLEKQLEEAKAKQSEAIAKEESMKSATYREKMEQLIKNEVELRAQVASYAEHFDQFKDTLGKSNEVFANFKTQMDKMSKRIKDLEKENATLKKTLARKDAMLIQTTNDKKALGKDTEAVRTQRDKMEKLCRTLQLERNALRESVRQLKIRLGEDAGASWAKKDDEEESFKQIETDRQAEASSKAARAAAAAVEEVEVESAEVETEVEAEQATSPGGPAEPESPAQI